MIVVLARHGQKDLRREHCDVARDKERVAQVGQRLDEQEQKGTCQARDEQRYGHGAKNVQLVGPQAVGGLFHRGVQALQHGANDEIGHRKERDGLHKHQPVHAINVVDSRRELYPQQLAGDETVAPKEQYGAQGNGKGGRDRGNQGQDVYQALAGNSAAYNGISKNKTQQRPRAGRQHAHDERAIKRLAGHGAIIRIKIATEITQVQLVLGVKKAVERGPIEGIKDKDKEENAAKQQADKEHRVAGDEGKFAVAPQSRAPGVGRGGCAHLRLLLRK